MVTAMVHWTNAKLIQIFPDEEMREAVADALAIYAACRVSGQKEYAGKDGDAK